MLFADALLVKDSAVPQPLRVAVIGTGFAEKVQIPVLQAHPATQVIAVCSRQEAHAKETAAKHNIPAYYTDYRQMFEREKPDLVSVVSPPYLHLEMTLAALASGAHVLCEKPLAMNVGEVEQMIAAAHQAKRMHFVNHEFRYLPQRYYQKMLFDQGYIGKPLFLEVTHMNGWHFDPTQPWWWWVDDAAGGGMVGAIGSHYVDEFRWCLGEDFAEISATLHYPYATRPDENGKPKPVTADEGATIVFKMQSGVAGCINMSSVTTGNVKRLAIHGTEGALVIAEDCLYGRTKGETDLKELAIPEQYQVPALDHYLKGAFGRLVDLMTAQIFGQVISDPRLVPANFHDGLAIQRVLDAAKQSHREGKRLAL